MHLETQGKWKLDPDTSGKLTSHTKVFDTIITAIPLSKEDQDSMTTLITKTLTLM